MTDEKTPQEIDEELMRMEHPSPIRYELVALNGEQQHVGKFEMEHLTLDEIIVLRADEEQIPAVFCADGQKNIQDFADKNKKVIVTVSTDVEVVELRVLRDPPKGQEVYTAAKETLKAIRDLPEDHKEMDEVNLLMSFLDQNIAWKNAEVKDQQKARLDLEGQVQFIRSMVERTFNTVVDELTEKNENVVLTPYLWAVLISDGTDPESCPVDEHVTREEWLATYSKGRK